MESLVREDRKRGCFTLDILARQQALTYVDPLRGDAGSTVGRATSLRRGVSHYRLCQLGSVSLAKPVHFSGAGAQHKSGRR